MLRNPRYATARKNAKTAICAVLSLAYLIGPSTRPWMARRYFKSLNKEKAGELRNQVEKIAIASNLKGLEFRRSPYPGKIISSSGAVRDP